MKKNEKNLLKMGILIPALVLSLAACGTSGTSDTAASEPAAETKTQETETTAAETPAETTAEAATEKVYENGGFKLTVAADMADKITVDTPEKSEDGVIFDVYETASVEAAKAKGEENNGLGWLFAICVRDADSVHNIMMDSLGGEDILAVDADGNYYVYYHPTDVRYERETTEKMQEDQDQWTAACDWANSVKESFISENTGLTAVNWGGTDVENWLARAMYGGDNFKYTVSTLEFGPLDPKDVDPKPYFDKLTTGATFERVEEEAPDGEYAVLNFEDQDTRLDFFFMEGKENYIRVTWNNDQNTDLYKVTYADGTTKASAVMQEWYDAIAKAQGLK